MPDALMPFDALSRLFLAIGLGALAVRFFLARRRRSVPTAAETDIREESLRNEIEPKAALRDGAGTAITEKMQEECRAGEESDMPIAWEERADVYMPEKAEAAAVLRQMGLDPPKIEPGTTFVALRRSAYETMQGHLSGDCEAERGGLLLGRACRDEALSAWLIVVEQALPAEQGLSTATSFAYTPTSWQAILPHLRKLHSAATIVGSFHSHPDMGVFLSDTDRETQAAIFSQEWQIAIVSDPVRGEFGIFSGSAGESCLQWRIVEEKQPGL